MRNSKAGEVMRLLLILILICAVYADEGKLRSTPSWAKDLVIYEVATKGFTSPDGPESGTFSSLGDKLPYLADLGINAIWLTGHSWSDPQHFYGIWTQYACIEPDSLDPSLGSEAEFVAMIDRAHELGIRIFLDTIEHGVMDYSDLVSEHPDWFSGRSWGMTDYDWEGDHPDLEEWWINIWTSAVLKWGVDGFRCDMGLHRPDLWEEIKRRCAAAGKEIVILGESGQDTVSHASQRDIMLYDIRKGRIDTHAALRDLASMEDLQRDQFTGETVTFVCEIKTADTLHVFTSNDADGLMSYTGVVDDIIGRWNPAPEGDPDWSWRLGAIDTSLVWDHIRIYSPQRSWHWQTSGSGWKLLVEKAENHLLFFGGDPLPGDRLRIIAPSCHDCGWDGFPLDRNSYTVRGSRHVMGYATLLAPAIPLFMAGEEFWADYVPLPGHTPGLFGNGEPGTGRWLYASWLQWDQLTQPEGLAMFQDTKRLLEIRRANADLIHAFDHGGEVELRGIDYEGPEDLPKPYMLINDQHALLVAANPGDHEIDLQLWLTTEDLSAFGNPRKIEIQPIWPQDGRSSRMRLRKIEPIRISIPADYQPGGGLAILHIIPG